MKAVLVVSRSNNTLRPCETAHPLTRFKDLVHTVKAKCSRSLPRIQVVEPTD